MLRKAPKGLNMAALNNGKCQEKVFHFLYQLKSK